MDHPFSKTMGKIVPINQCVNDATLITNYITCPILKGAPLQRDIEVTI
jgi:hypothetical protein